MLVVLVDSSMLTYRIHLLGLPIRLALEEMEDCGLSDSSFAAEQDELRALQDELGTKTVAMNQTMEESRRQLAQLLSGSHPPTYNKRSPHRPRTHPTSTVLAQRPWSSDTVGLLQELAQLVENEPTTADLADHRTCTPQPCNITSTTATVVDDWQELGSAVSSTANLRVPQRRREPRSEAYRSWVAQRSQRASELASYRDRRSVDQAQQSMRNFNQTLAALHAEERGRMTR